jgi:hypothetical protein
MSNLALLLLRLLLLESNLALLLESFLESNLLFLELYKVFAATRNYIVKGGKF